MSARLDRIFSKETSNRGPLSELCKELCVLYVYVDVSLSRFWSTVYLETVSFLNHELTLWLGWLSRLMQEFLSHSPCAETTDSSTLGLMWVLMIRILVISLTQKVPYLLSHLSSSQNSQRTQYQEIKSSDRNMSQSPYQTLVNGIGKRSIQRDHLHSGLL